MTATNIYEEILENIDADKKAWCQGDWAQTDDDGRPVSRCLVEHVDLAVGTTYLKSNGEVFVSKDVKRWRRRERVLAHLASLLPKQVVDKAIGASYFDEDYVERRRAEATTPFSISKGAEAVIRREAERASEGKSFVDRRPFDSLAQDVVVSFNDSSTTSKAKVRNLLKRAAKSHPED